CTSSPKTASNFGKRKYTKGHFADPVAKVKMEYKPYDDSTISPGTHATPSENSDNTAVTKYSDKKDVQPGFTTKPTNVAPPFGSQPKQEAYSIAKNPSSANPENNVSLKENSTVNAYPYVEQSHPYERSGNDNSSGLLIAWILALAISVLCYLLLIAYITSVATGASATAGTGCLLVVLGTFAFVAAIVLFILWVVALSR
ncbi:MAG TPA: hypothetical protein VK809_06520, partial [Bacteroidia bacterium]|nr:hypothetical protein [Bacteroidia bacterium]